MEASLRKERFEFEEENNRQIAPHLLSTTVKTVCLSTEQGPLQRTTLSFADVKEGAIRRTETGGGAQRQVVVV